MKYSHNYFLLGILCGLLALARIDFFLLIFVWIIVLLSRKELKGSLFISGGFLLLYLPYALTNFFSTGYMEPITGILKSSFPKVNLHFDLQFTVTALISIFTALAASVFYIIFSFSRVFIRRTKNPFLFILASTIIIHFLFYLLFTKWAVLNYYFIFYGVFLAFISAEFINFKKYKITAQIFLTIAALFVFGKLLLNINKDIENSWHAKAYDAAVWAKANTSPGEIFAMKDAGNFAFFSERKVINLDGLVNDYLYQEFLKEKKLNLYLKKNNVSYYVLYESSAAPELWRGEYDKYEETFTSYMYMTECDKISIMKNKEIYRENFAEDINSVFIIWKLE